jgi:hypothetical protein
MWPLAVAPVNISTAMFQHAKEEKRFEQSSDVKRHFFAAAKQLKVDRRRVSPRSWGSS